jgi:hypothetical protein
MLKNSGKEQRIKDDAGRRASRKNRTESFNYGTATIHRLFDFKSLFGGHSKTNNK